MVVITGAARSGILFHGFVQGNIPYRLGRQDGGQKEPRSLMPPGNPGVHEHDPGS